MAGKFQNKALSQLSQKLAEFTVNFKINEAPKKVLENATAGGNRLCQNNFS